MSTGRRRGGEAVVGGGGSCGGGAAVGGSCTCTSAHPPCSVVVETLAGLLEVGVAPVGQGAPDLGQVLPVKGPPAQLLALPLAPGPLDGQRVEAAGSRNSPHSWMPGREAPSCPRPGPKH